MPNELTRVHCVIKGLFDSKRWGTSNIWKIHLSLLLLNQICEQFIYPLLLWIYVIKPNSNVETIIPSYIFSPNGCFLAGMVVSHASGRDGSFFGFLITSLDSWYNNANLSKHIKTWYCSATYIDTQNCMSVSYILWILGCLLIVHSSRF